MLLDIEIHGNKTAGLELARRFKLPVLFISGRTQEELKQIEEIQRIRLEMPVEHLTKPFDEVSLRQALERFVRLIDVMSKPQMVVLPQPNGDKVQVRSAEIVLIRVPGSQKDEDDRSEDERKHAKGNNKEVLFTVGKPCIAANLTLGRLSDDSFPEGSMIQISRWACVNPDRVIKYQGNNIVVEYMGRNGVREKETIKVGEAHMRDLLAHLQKRGTHP